MPHLSHSDPSSAPSLRRRIDGVLGHLNAALLAIAIGLALLDFTCFLGMMSLTEIRRAEQNAFLMQEARPSLR